MKRAGAFLLLSLFAMPLAAQQPASDLGLLRYISGTAANPGPVPHQGVVFSDGAWKAFVDGAVFATYVSETGPAEQRDEVFSTNWVAMGIGRNYGRASIAFKGRISLEPYTLPDEGYPQVLQYVSAENGGPLIDFMRAGDLFQEAAVHIGVNTTQSSYFHLYGAWVGDPAFGALPSAQRASGVDFAEAPFSYDIQESTHDSTKVVTLGWASPIVSLEGSVFHDSATFGDHTDIEDGDIDSRSARLTVTPTPSLAIQVSRAELGENEETTLSSASIAYSSGMISATALYTLREAGDQPEYSAYGIEVALRGLRNTFMVRAEKVERPANLFGDTGEPGPTEMTGHFTVGYIFDVATTRSWRGGVGVNIDYHTNTKELEELPQYGHKPQGIYAFVRLRTNR